MKRFQVGTVALVASGMAAPAVAADLSVKPVYKAPPVAVAPAFSWQRCYIGGQVGYGWGKTDDNLSEQTITVTTSINADTQSTSGWIAGGQAGCNWQPSKTFVVGIEGDFWWSDIKGLAADGPEISFRARNRWDGDITLRLGVPVDRALLYVKGGAAVGHFDYTLNFFSSTFSGDSTRWGWLIGAGIEFALDYNWSIKVEYNYIDFGHHDVDIGFGDPVQVHDRKNIIKFGLNYQLGDLGRGPISTRY